MTYVLEFRVIVYCHASSLDCLRQCGICFNTDFDCSGTSLLRRKAQTHSFTHESGTRFRGTGLVYAYDRSTLACSGQTPDWRTRHPIGSLNDGKLSQSVYWGLCQLEPETDTGVFSTTATVRFWVN